MSLHPPKPVATPVSAPFWEGVKAGKLLLQRCRTCSRLQFPPTDTCRDCAGDEFTMEEMSGLGKVFSFTETVSGARHPYFQSQSPYLVGQVELDEQAGLIMATNFPGSTYVQLSVGAPVRVEFETIADDAVLPQFRVV